MGQSPSSVVSGHMCAMCLCTLPSTSNSSCVFMCAWAQPMSVTRTTAQGSSFKLLAVPPSICPHVPQPSPCSTRGHIPSQTLPEVPAAPWVQADRGGLDHQMVPVDQGSQVGQGCPGGQRCSVSWGCGMSWGCWQRPPGITTPIPTGVPGSPFRPGSPCVPSTITLGSP